MGASDKKKLLSCAEEDVGRQNIKRERWYWEPVYRVLLYTVGRRVKTWSLWIEALKPCNWRHTGTKGKPNTKGLSLAFSMQSWKAGNYFEFRLKILLTPFPIIL
jgi:hypothetical protein